MQIIIPMSGFGERFRRAGYSVPKPLIEVDGKPVIAHVVDLFPGESNFLFICNQDHLDTPAFRMAEILERHCPGARIHGIAPHKLGPVHAVMQVADHIDPDAPAIVNYCDFACYWDYRDFKSFVTETRCHGALPAYRHFHPHSLGPTLYAIMRETDGWMTDIQEKQPFTDKPNEEFASSGTYYFASGALIKAYFAETMRQDLTVGDEFYASLVYKPMIADGLDIAVYELQHFMQWGTPEDLREYQRWSATFARLASEGAAPAARHGGSMLMPMAGLGKRFSEAGYATPKPLIPVSGLPMAVQATRDLPAAPATRFVLRRDLPERETVEAELARSVPGGSVRALDGLTDGQARTCLLGLDGLDLDAPLTIGACDNGLLYDAGVFARLIDDADTDVLVWVARGHPQAIRRPEMFGWVDADAGGLIRGVSVKTPLADPAADPIITGAFSFARGRDFVAAAERMIGRNARINGEFYVDTAIGDAVALGLRCRIFEIDHYLGWGTPDDLKTFEYWQSCFHKWPSHPYRLEHDKRVPARAVSALDRRYAASRPARPVPR